jgi:putative ABC transport system ATP-binding protein
VIADEPTSALDRDRQQDFLALLFGEVGRVGATLVMVSHDQSLAPQFDAVVEIAAIARIEPGPLGAR